MEEASCRSFCPPEAAEAPSLPAAHEIAQLPPPELKRDTDSHKTRPRQVIIAGIN